MWNFGKKIRALCDKKINILTLVLSEKEILNQSKNHNPPPFKLNGRSLNQVFQKKNQNQTYMYIVSPENWSQFIIAATYACTYIASIPIQSLCEGSQSSNPSQLSQRVPGCQIKDALFVSVILTHCEVH